MNVYAIFGVRKKSVSYKEVHSAVMKLSVWDEYLDILIYFNILKKKIFPLNSGRSFPRRIYLDIHSWSIYTEKYIGIFIRPISIITNIFVFSVQYGSKITQNMKIDQKVQNNLGKIIWYSIILEYFGRIYSFANIFIYFF